MDINPLVRKVHYPALSFDIIDIIGSYPNFFRMVCVAPQGRESDMDFLLSEIERLGKDL